MEIRQIIVGSKMKSIIQSKSLLFIVTHFISHCSMFAYLSVGGGGEGGGWGGGENYVRIPMNNPNQFSK